MHCWFKTSKFGVLSLFLKQIMRFFCNFFVEPTCTGCGDAVKSIIFGCYKGVSVLFTFKVKWIPLTGVSTRFPISVEKTEKSQIWARKQTEISVLEFMSSEITTISYKIEL